MRYLILFIAFIYTNNIFCTNTVGLQLYDTTNTQGYILFSPITSKDVFLIDKCGKLANSWQTNHIPGQSSFLLDNGDLIRAGLNIGPFYNIGGKGGVLERYDWNNNLIWSFKMSDYDNCLHHDFKVLPNGNILALVWSEIRPLTTVIEMGRNPDFLGTYIFTERIIEIKPIGTDSATVVWVWNLADHLIQDFDSTKSNFGRINEHPELVDINFNPNKVPNWVHINAIEYNKELDQILLCAHAYNEIWIIDHSTTTIEAKSHIGGRSGKGGDLLFRWGNPSAYKLGDSTNQYFFGQHHAQWIKSGYKNAGKIIVFNNGLNRTNTNFSSIDIIAPTFDTSLQSYNLNNNQTYFPDTIYWTYKNSIPENFYSSYVSGVQPLKDGSFLICSGADGVFFEIDSLNNKTWQYTNPVNNFGAISQGDSVFNNNVFRCTYYPEDFAGFIDKDFILDNEIELNPTRPALCEQQILSSIFPIISTNKIKIFPNPTTKEFYVETSMDLKNFNINIYNMIGEKMNLTIKQDNLNSIKILCDGFVKGIYLLQIKIQDEITNYKIAIN